MSGARLMVETTMGSAPKVSEGQLSVTAPAEPGHGARRGGPIVRSRAIRRLTAIRT